MTPEQYLLDTAIQTLRGEIATLRMQQPNLGDGYFQGKHNSLWYVSGMARALTILEEVSYGFVQMNIETTVDQ